MYMYMMLYCINLFKGKVHPSSFQELYYKINLRKFQHNMCSCLQENNNKLLHDLFCNYVSQKVARQIAHFFIRKLFSRR